MEPVGMVETGRRAPEIPMRMMAPLPYCFSIWDTARSRAFSRSLRSSLTGGFRVAISAMRTPSALWAHRVSGVFVSLRDFPGEVNTVPTNIRRAESQTSLGLQWVCRSSRPSRPTYENRERSQALYCARVEGVIFPVG